MKISILTVFSGMTFIILGGILIGFYNDIFLLKSHTSKNDVSAVLQRYLWTAK